MEIKDTVHTGWLFTRDQEKFAPFTLADSIITKDGQSFNIKLESRLRALEKNNQQLNSSITSIEKQVGNIKVMQDTIAGLRSELLKKPGLLVEGKNYALGTGSLLIAGKGAEVFNNLDNNVALGEYSHAEGDQTIANAAAAHTEGYSTVVNSAHGHAEGSETIVNGVNGHAEGYATKAIGSCSHAEGCGTETSAYAGHVEGKYNIKTNSDNYIHIAGNGSSDINRSNAYTLDWNGNGWYKGGLSFDGIMKMTSNMYGAELPETGVEGQLFFLVID